MREWKYLYFKCRKRYIHEWDERLSEWKCWRAISAHLPTLTTEFSNLTLKTHGTYNISRRVKSSSSCECIWNKQESSPLQPATWFLYSSSFWPGYFDGDFLAIPLNHFVLENVADLKKRNFKVAHYGKADERVVSPKECPHWRTLQPDLGREDGKHQLNI